MKLKLFQYNVNRKLTSVNMQHLSQPRKCRNIQCGYHHQCMFSSGVMAVVSGVNILFGWRGYESVMPWRGESGVADGGCRLALLNGYGWPLSRYQ